MNVMQYATIEMQMRMKNVLPCLRHVTGHNCHGPTHQCVGHGSSLQTRTFSLGRSFSACVQHSSSSTSPLLSSWQTDRRRCVPPPHVAEQTAHSPNFHLYTAFFVAFVDKVYSYFKPGLLLLPRTRTWINERKKALN